MCAKLDWSDLFANSMYIIRNYFLGFFFFFARTEVNFLNMSTRNLESIASKSYSEEQKAKVG